VTVARRNIEIKCRVPTSTASSKRRGPWARRHQGVLRQKDTFFAAPRARLKLRELGTARSSSATDGGTRPKPARDYVVLPIPDPK
jgi:hypothetical protein